MTTPSYSTTNNAKQITTIILLLNGRTSIFLTDKDDALVDPVIMKHVSAKDASTYRNTNGMLVFDISKSKKEYVLDILLGDKGTTKATINSLVQNEEVSFINEDCYLLTGGEGAMPTKLLSDMQTDALETLIND